MNKNISIGDVVEHVNTPGLRLTVVAVDLKSTPQETTVECAWFVGTVCYQDSFKASDLARKAPRK